MTTSPTIAKIAEEAGVSIPTVSKVLNGRPDVSPVTRDRVEEILERFQYRKRREKRSISSGLIELAFHELGSAWSLEIIQGVEDVAAQNRLGVVLSDLGGAHRPRQEWLDDVLHRSPVGVILVLSDLDESQQRQLETRSIPFVVVDTAGEPPEGVPTVGSANWNGGLAATRHLISLGHRHIAAVTGPDDVLCSRARVDGYRAALDEAGIVFDPDLVRHGDFTVSGGYDHGRDLLARPDRPTAVFGGSDLQSMGVMRAARELGLHVPEDLSVVGYDDIPVAQWIDPPLTTVRQPLWEMAATAADLVVSLARGDQPANQRVDLATELIERESAAPPKA